LASDRKFASLPLTVFYFSQPVNLEDTDFTFGVMEEGDYEGLPFVGIKATNFEKGNCITLKNVYLEHGDDCFHRIPDDVGDKYSIYKLLTLCSI
jgi:hypothetical protein